MQSNFQNKINTALKELHTTKSISSALLVCNTLLEYMGVETKNIEDIELSKLKLPNSERYDRWFDAHPHFRGDRACFELTAKEANLFEAKFYSLQKRSKLFIAGAVNFTPNFEDRDYTRNDPNMKVGIDFFFTPEKDSVIVVLSNKGSLRLVELSGRLTNTQHEIFVLWQNVAHTVEKNVLHTTIWESFKLSSLNKKFYEGMVNSFTSLTQHMQSSGVEDQLANQFANRLLGRLLFIWFLRKKHIINEESKDYFTISDQEDTVYYRDKLAYLFFNVLNTAIPDRDRVQETKNTLFGVEKENPTLFAIDSLTPYLNGGLFDPKADGEYWNKHNPVFPIGFFKTLYDHFDSFNFTTDESTPEYEQIAIDPEMLGRIFESFLATLTTETGSQAKKANGAFYTPREIVSYMSRESLRQYLYTALDATITLKTSIDDLLDLPDSEWALAGTNSKRDAVSKDDRDRIMEALRSVKVLDPAVGSGAFPMGVLHKILSLFERLEPNFDSYETKLSILKNNIYGVDIDPTAIEISRLRAWLSIIVDVKDIKKIKPLPNLDFKFVCANTLIGLDKGEVSFTSDANLKPELIRIRDEYYATSSKVKKEKLQKEYTKFTHKISLFDNEETRQLKSYRPFENGKSASFYDPELMHGVEAFDVVIGNPPYVDSETMVKNNSDLRNLYTSLFKYARGNWDLFIIFIEQGIKLLSSGGNLSFIVPNKLIAAKYSESLRSYLLTKNINFIRDYSDVNVFKDASVYPIVFQISNQLNIDSNVLLTKMSGIEEFELFNTIPHSLFYEDIYWDRYFIRQDALQVIIKISNNLKLEEINSLVLGAATVSEAYKIKEFVIEQNSKTEEYKKLINSGTIDPYISLWGKKRTQYIKASYGSPVVKNESLGKLSAKRLKQSNSSKLIIAGMSKRLEVFYDQGEYLAGKSTTIILENEKINLLYLLAILNSKLVSYWYKIYFSSLSLAGGYLRISNNEVKKIPVVVPNVEYQEKIITIVNKIIVAKRNNLEANIEDFESQIDTLVYQLYGLSEEEIKIIENS